MDETTTTLEGPITKPDGQALHPSEDAPLGTTMISEVQARGAAIEPDVGVVEAPAGDARELIEHAVLNAALSDDVVLAVDGKLDLNEPRVRMMTRPAPVPPGYTSLEMPQHGVWFLVRLDPSCGPCKGSGKERVVDKDSGYGGTKEVSCGNCVVPAVNALIEQKAALAEERLAEERAEQADERLRERVEKARAAVTEIEQKRDATIGDCERETAEITARLPELAASIESCDKLAHAYKQQAALATADVNALELVAAGVRDEAVRSANAAFVKVQQQAARSRQEIAAGLQRQLGEVDANKSTSTQLREEAEARLAYLKAGPEKIRRRWEDKLQPARATLQRLERQFNR